MSDELNTTELTIWVDDVPVQIMVQSPDEKFETALKALHLAGREETLMALIDQAAEIVEGRENE